jgi:hypothetical protein
MLQAIAKPSAMPPSTFGAEAPSEPSVTYDGGGEVADKVVINYGGGASRLVDARRR